MKMFNLIAIGERAGSGVPDIYSVWASQGWQTPVVEEQFDPDRTVLTLPLVLKQTKKASDNNKRKKQANKTSELKQAKKTVENKKKILDYLSGHKEASSQEIADYLELSQARIRVLLKELTDSNDILAIGQTKARRYSLNKSK